MRRSRQRGNRATLRGFWLRAEDVIRIVMSLPKVLLRVAPRTLLGVVMLAPVMGWSHVSQGETGGGFLSGFLHPMFGPDHVIAMIAVGIWGAQLGIPAIWLLPVTFPIVMAIGAVLGALGLPIPGVKFAIALSAVALGAMVALAARPPLWIAAMLVGAFAIFHGYPHGANLADSVNPMGFAIGFVVATGTLHAIGILIGVANRWPGGARLLRAIGAAIAAGGIYFLASYLVSA